MITLTTIEEANSELTLRLRQQELAAEFANFGLRTDDLQPVLDEACRVASKGMECSLSKVLEYLPGTERFIMRAGVGWGPGVVGHAILGTDLESPAGYAFRTGQPVLSNHLSQETRFRTPKLLVDHDVHRAFNVLVATDEWRYGVLEVDSPDERDFTIADTAFLVTLAATLAQAIAKQRRMRELEESRRQLAEMNGRLHSHVAERTRERDHLWELGADLLIMADYEGHLLRVNPYWTRLLGWTEEELFAGGYVSLIHPDDIDTVMATLGHMRDTSQSVTFENRVRAKDGSWRWIAWSLSPEPGRERLTGVGRDATELKDKQEQLSMAQDSLRQSQKMEAMGQLTGGVAHDFNNLLTPIIGSLDMLVRRGVGTERERRLIDGALQSADRAKTLVQRLLAFARRQPLQAVPVDLRVLIDGMAALIGSTVGPSIEVRVDLAADLPPVPMSLNHIMK